MSHEHKYILKFLSIKKNSLIISMGLSIIGFSCKFSEVFNRAPMPVIFFKFLK